MSRQLYYAGNANHHIPPFTETSENHRLKKVPAGRRYVSSQEGILLFVQSVILFTFCDRKSPLLCILSSFNHLN